MTLKQLFFSCCLLLAFSAKASDIKLPALMHCKVQGQTTLSAVGMSETTEFSQSLFISFTTFSDHLKIQTTTSSENIGFLRFSVRLIDPATGLAEPYIYRLTELNGMGCVGANKSKNQLLEFNQSCSGKAKLPGSGDTITLLVDSLKIDLSDNKISGLSTVQGDMFNPALNKNHKFKKSASYDGLCETIR